MNVANLDIQPDDALNRTRRTSLNVTWPRMLEAEVVIEVLLRARVDKNGQNGKIERVADRSDRHV